jgi:hypothetical protein
MFSAVLCGICVNPNNPGFDTPPFLSKNSYYIIDI